MLEKILSLVKFIDAKYKKLNNIVTLRNGAELHPEEIFTPAKLKKYHQVNNEIKLLREKIKVLQSCS